MKLTEFYTEMQGRPDSKVTLDMESRQPIIPTGYVKGVMLKASYTETSKTENYTAAEETVILVDSSGSSITITLPAASTNTGKFYHVKKVDSSGNNVTVKGNATTETIDGEESVSMAIQYQHIMVLCDGSDWWILGGVNVKLETILEDLMNKEIELQRQMLTELRQNKLHLASMTDEDISEKDAEDAR